MLQRLERKFGWLAIPHLTVYLVAGQTFFFLAILLRPELFAQMVLQPQAVMAGEVWRLLTFVFIPPQVHPIFIIFALYLLWLMGEALEDNWGTFRYNLFLLVGWLATLASAWIQPSVPATNVYLLGSVFLAFAFLYPEFRILLLLIIPVKVKWLAALTWVLYGLGFLRAATDGNWSHCMVIVAAVANFFLFFWPDLLEMVRRRGRRMRQEVVAMEARRAAEEPFHRCTTCGRTEQSDPELEFRYCPHCTDSPCYCMDHIFDHEHR
ncbi:MAG: rhomboid family intramembrane serine protease [Phycisphaeraceae bacterium]